MLSLRSFASDSDGGGWGGDSFTRGGDSGVGAVFKGGCFEVDSDNARFSVLFWTRKNHIELIQSIAK